LASASGTGVDALLVNLITSYCLVSQLRPKEIDFMSNKENAAIGPLLSLLESRYAIRVLWALKDGHPQTFRLLQDSVGSITPNTLNTRIKELREAGLLSHGGDGYHVTALGADLLKRMGDLSAFATKWATSQLKASVKAA
jgi:DNA-binding HxlR family transcriptional regulator